MEVLPFAFCLAIDRGKCYNKIIKCMRLHIFTLSFSKSLEVLYLQGNEQSQKEANVSANS